LASRNGVCTRPEELWQRRASVEVRREDLLSEKFEEDIKEVHTGKRRI
jgi:hypothetical protein